MSSWFGSVTWPRPMLSIIPSVSASDIHLLGLSSLAVKAGLMDFEWKKKRCFLHAMGYMYRSEATDVQVRGMRWTQTCQMGRCGRAGECGRHRMFIHTGRRQRGKMFWLTSRYQYLTSSSLIISTVSTSFSSDHGLFNVGHNWSRNLPLRRINTCGFGSLETSFQRLFSKRPIKSNRFIAIFCLNRGLIVQIKRVNVLITNQASTLIPLEELVRSSVLCSNHRCTADRSIIPIMLQSLKPGRAGEQRRARDPDRTRYSVWWSLSEWKRWGLVFCSPVSSFKYDLLLWHGCWRCQPCSD